MAKFTVKRDYVLISMDYSQQEPRILAHMSGDKGLIDAYLHGKDLYAHVGSLALGMPYEDCLEHFPDGSVNKEGKERRSRMKVIVLALLYGMSDSTLADTLGISVQEARGLMASFFRGFPKVRKFIDDSQDFARRNGYVKTNWGRKRRLPDMTLEPFEYEFANGVSNDFDPLAGLDSDDGRQEVPKETKDYWNGRLLRASRKSRAFLIRQALSENIRITDNTSKIATAERQVVNSMIQGSAGDMVKRASILCRNDPRLIERDCHIVIWVHDELICTCPREFAWECADIISENMKKAAEGLAVPMKTDAEITKVWYGEEIRPEKSLDGVSN